MASENPDFAFEAAGDDVFAVGGKGTVKTTARVALQFMEQFGVFGAVDSQFMPGNAPCASTLATNLLPSALKSSLKVRTRLYRGSL